MTTSSELEELKTLFESCPDLFCIVSVEGYFLRLNPAWTQVLGYSEDELLSRPFVDFIHPDDIEPSLAETRLLVSESHTTVSFENRYRKKDGSYIWLTWSANAKHGNIYAFAKDITKIKRNEIFLSTIQDHARIGGWSLNVKDFTTTWTEETYRLHEVPIGTPTDAAKGIEFYHPDYREKIRKYVIDCIENKQAYDDIFKFITAKGRSLWVRVTGYPMLNNDGQVTHLIGTFQDVDKLKLLTDELAKTTTQFNDVLQNSPGMVYQFQLDPDGSMFFPYSSPQAFEIYEITPEAFKANPALMLSMAHPDDKQDLSQKISESAATLNPFQWTGRIITARGALKWINAKSSPRKLENGSILWNGIVVDVTKEKELEKSLLEQRHIAEHTARLASLGELAAGVGHEINNPLAIVIGNLEKLDREFLKLAISNPRIVDTLRKMGLACERIKKIVVGLRHLAYGTYQNEKESGELMESLKGTLDLISEIYAKEGIIIDLKSDSQLKKVACSPIHIQQILINLLTNAKDACREIAHPLIIVHVTEHGTFWQVSIQDNGTGISPENQQKLFSAFFSTKAVGKGTGLGLAISKSIIESCGGKISFDSSPKGTTFYVDFPKSEGETKSDAPSEPAIQKTHSPLRVLVIDDEDEIRTIVKEILEQFECSVMEASNAQQGLEHLKKMSFDLILTDIKMPGMDGLNFLNEVATKHLADDATKILLTGGITEEVSQDSNRFQIGVFDGVLSKPFGTQELANIVLRVQRTKNQLKIA